jgi:hypothetical protein
VVNARSIIGGAVVVCYSPIDDRHRPTGTCLQAVGGVLQGSAAVVAICGSDSSGYFLFGCDSLWRTLTDTWHRSLEEAMDQAEFEYAGITNTWVFLNPADGTTAK